MTLKTYNDFLQEGLKTKEIDPKQFPDPNKNNMNYFIDGKRDGEMTDDIVHTKFAGIPAKQLKPSQDAVYLGKALGMAINGVVGGDLGAVISKDNRILDGHHRWAATIFNDPNAKVNGVKAELNIGDLVPVLRAAGDALGNNRGLPPEGGDINIFKATIQDVKDCCYEGKHMDLKYFNKQKAIEWFESKGEVEIKQALAIINRVGPPAGAPPRQDMPKIKPDQVDKVANDLNSGKIDVRTPYNESLLPSFNEFLNESTSVKIRKGEYILHNELEVSIPIKVTRVNKTDIEYDCDYNMTNKDYWEDKFIGTDMEGLGYDPFESDFSIDDIENVVGKNIYLKKRKN